MAYKYKYNGIDVVELSGHVGLVKPGDVFESENEINHPNFESVSAQTKVKEEPKVEVKEEKVAGK